MLPSKLSDGPLQTVEVHLREYLLLNNYEQSIAKHFPHTALTICLKICKRGTTSIRALQVRIRTALRRVLEAKVLLEAKASTQIYELL
jgi:hypothetical protein